MAASVATGSPLPESGLLQGGAETDADALIEQSRQLAATPFGDRDRLASILLAAGQPAPTPQHLPVYALALLAQFAFELGSTALRDRLGLGVSPSSILRFMVWIWAVDAALTPVAILVALGCGTRPWLIVLTLPLMGLLAYFARERQVRI